MEEITCRKDPGHYCLDRKAEYPSRVANVHKKNNIIYQSVEGGIMEVPEGITTEIITFY